MDPYIVKWPWITAHDTFVEIRHSLKTAEDTQHFVNLFTEDFRESVTEFILKGYYPNHWVHEKIWLYVHDFGISSSIFYKIIRACCAFEDGHCLLQILADEELKLKIQKEIFEVI